MLFSSLRNTQSMQNFQIPLPIIVSNHKPVDESAANPSNVPVSGATYVPLSAPVYECSPFEFGSFDPQLSAFIPSEFLGTSLNAGNPFIASSVIKAAQTDPKNSCVRGFDQLSFIMGSSATVEYLDPGVHFLPLNLRSTLIAKYFYVHVLSPFLLTETK